METLKIQAFSDTSQDDSEYAADRPSRMGLTIADNFMRDQDHMKIENRYGYCESSFGPCTPVRRSLESAANLLRLDEEDRDKFVSVDELPCRSSLATHSREVRGA